MISSNVFRSVFGNPFGNPFVGRGRGGIKKPPVSDKLIAWLSGANLTTAVKLEYINNYNFTFDNCPKLPVYAADGVTPIYGADGVTPIYTAGFIIAGWVCDYLAPVSGEPGHTELLAIDDGTLYTGIIPNILDLATLEAIINNQMFFCADPGKGFGIYDSVLIGSELTLVSNFFT